MNNNSNLANESSILASLRSVMPRRRLSFPEALQIAELQANRLLEISGITDSPTPSEIVSELPRIQVELRDLPTSGLTFWSGEAWVICLDRSEPATRQRFTLLHEYKHVVDHGRTHQLYIGDSRHTADEQAERAADYFAGCALMPKRLMKRAWGEQLQRPRALALAFEVSAKAVEVRLDQLGLTEPKRRCAPVTARSTDLDRDRYHRGIPSTPPAKPSPQEATL
jgi:Zn-dependent peptidase ImmA (M78 family)